MGNSYAQTQAYQLRPITESQDEELDNMTSSSASISTRKPTYISIIIPSHIHILVLYDASTVTGGNSTEIRNIE